MTTRSIPFAPGPARDPGCFGSSEYPRRRFLVGAAAASLGVLSGCATAEPGPQQAAGDIDAHVHVWSPDLARYPIHPEFKASDMQPASFTPEQLFAHTRANGVGRVVLIQMSFYRYDNRYMLDAIRRWPGVFAGVAVVDELATGLARTMRELKRQGVRGFRIHPGTRPVADWLGSAGMEAMWTVGADEGMAMCPLINPAALPAIDAMCVRFPKTRVVVDHFARIGVDGEIRDRDLDALCRLSRHANVFVKTSAFYALGRKKPPYSDLAPMIRRLRDAYGAGRLMWASDSPYQVDPCHTYVDSIELIRTRLDFLSGEDRVRMLRTTAASVFFG